jgi:hypothetical protein
LFVLQCNTKDTGKARIFSIQGIPLSISPNPNAQTPAPSSVDLLIKNFRVVRVTDVKNLGGRGKEGEILERRFDEMKLTGLLGGRVSAAEGGPVDWRVRFLHCL